MGLVLPARFLGQTFKPPRPYGHQGDLPATGRLHAPAETRHHHDVCREAECDCPATGDGPTGEVEDSLLVFALKGYSM